MRNEIFKGCSQLNEITISGNGEMFNWNTAEKYPWNQYKDQINEIVIENFDPTITAGSYYTVGNFFQAFSEDRWYRI